MPLPKIKHVGEDGVQGTRVCLLKRKAVDIDMLVWITGSKYGRKQEVLRGHLYRESGRSQTLEWLQICFPFFLWSKIYCIEANQGLYNTLVTSHQ